MKATRRLRLIAKLLAIKALSRTDAADLLVVLALFGEGAERLLGVERQAASLQTQLDQARAETAAVRGALGDGWHKLLCEGAVRIKCGVPVALRDGGASHRRDAVEAQALALTGNQVCAGPHIWCADGTTKLDGIRF